MTNTDNSVPQVVPEPPEVKMQNSFANPPISQESVPNMPTPEPVSQMASTQFAPSNSPQVPMMPYRKPFNIVKTGFMIMILVLLVVGGYVGYQQYKSNSESSETTEEVTPTAASGSESVPTVAINEPEEETKSGTPSSQTVSSPGVEIVDFSECSPGD